MNCPACGAADPQIFYEVRNVPTTSNLLMKSREAAIDWPRGNVTLAHCAECGFITNTSFQPSTQALNDQYQATQACSPTFGSFARRLAQEWTTKYKLRRGRLVEIGSGDGSFLSMFCQIAEAEGVGIDPIADPAKSTERVRFIAEMFSPRHLDPTVSFIYCRHTLEHIADVGNFVGTLASGIREHCRGFVPLAIEVPDTLRVLDEAAFWDIYYEHCSYFTAESLCRLLNRNGFGTTDGELMYDGQYLVVEAWLEENVRVAAAVPMEIDAFQERVERSLQNWRQTIENSGRCVLWGAGSKAVGFLATLNVGDEVKAVVDINPAKQNSFLPGTGHEIVPPDRLREIKPDRVIVMNPVYAKEIEASLESMGLRPAISLLS